MRILRRFTFPVLCVFYLVACNTAQTIPVEALGDTPTGVTTRFVFPTSGSNAEAYLTRPAGPGPFPLMILLHGHTFDSIAGADSVVPEAELLPAIFAMPVWPFRFQVMVEQKCRRVWIQKLR
ncbi:MAG TPA: hypothetical protein VGA01_10755 [Candidatus Binatia bacterium]